MLGKRTACTPRATKAVADALSTGCRHSDAAAAAGIGETTFYRWLEDGRKGLEPFKTFLEAVDTATHAAKMRAIQRIYDDPSWQSKAWWLERRFPDEYGRKTETRLVAQSPEVDVDLSQLTRDELVTYYELRMKAAVTDKERIELQGHLETVRALPPPRGKR